MFLFKKLVAPFFYPFSICLELLLIGLFLLWFTSRKRAGKWLVTMGVVLMVVVGQGALPAFFLERLESRYPPLDLTPLGSESVSPIKWIVVLGGGHNSDPHMPLTSQLSSSSLVRLIEGINLHRALPGSTLVLSGGAVHDPVSTAETMALLARLLGVDQAELMVELASKDTAEQAQQLQSLVGRDQFVLVTSALHMPRAMALFEKLGMQPLPAPTAHGIVGSQGSRPWWFLSLPTANGFVTARNVMHEYLGLAWAKLWGKI